jgi:CubicO group peptidase (beta-lactamase class C family)
MNTSIPSSTFGIGWKLLVLTWVIPLALCTPFGAFLPVAAESQDRADYSLPEAVLQATANPALQTGLFAERYQDPDGRFSIVIPIHWKATQEQGYGLLTGPDNAIRAYVLSVPAGDPEKGIASAWKAVNPDFKLQTAQVDQQLTPDSVEQEVKIMYDSGDPQRAVFAKGDLVQGRVYVVLVDGNVDAIQKRASQLDIVQDIQIAAAKKLDLTGNTPRPVDASITLQWEAYIHDAMQRASIPAIEVAVVQDGKVAYLNAFGVKELGKPDPVDTDTRMLIGSTTKAMTTMMMASLVDSGKLNWDTPAVELYPSFAMADPKISPRITIRNLVCNCSGVPRKDVEFFFHGGQVTPQELIASLQTYQFFTPFGEAFQYSNQMVASGGYIAAIAGSGDPKNLRDGYEAQMKERIFDPISMPSSTFSFQEAVASGNYALPHAADVSGQYIPVPLQNEYMVQPGEPAGGLWSNVKDMSRYLITQMSQGVSPDGKRVVSAENLSVTWTPQVQTSATAGYALGWEADHFEGLRLIQHSGATTGFSTYVAFLPEARLGVVVMTNNRPDGDAFVSAVAMRLFELAFGIPELHENAFDFALAKQKKAFESQSSMFAPELDLVAIAPYLGRYHNDALGDISLTLQRNLLILQTSGFATPLRATKQQGTYLLAEGTLAGLPIVFGKNANAEPELTLSTPLGVYQFARLHRMDGRSARLFAR